MVKWSDLDNELRQGLVDIDAGVSTEKPSTFIRLQELGLVGSKKTEYGVKEFVTPEGEQLVADNYFDPELEAEGLMELFTEYHEAKLHYKAVFDNPPSANARGQWPHWYVGNLQRAEKRVENALAMLGRWMVQNEAEVKRHVAAP